MRVSRWVAEDALLARVGFRGAEAAKGYLLVRAITITRSGATPWTAYNLTVANHHTFFVGKSRAWVHNECAIGFTPDTVASAFNMRKGGGHAIRHLQEYGLIPNTGSLQERVERFKEIVTPILVNPERTVDWRVGDTLGRAFLRKVGGEYLAVIVAKDGEWRGSVITAFRPTPQQLEHMLGRK